MSSEPEQPVENLADGLSDDVRPSGQAQSSETVLADALDRLLDALHAGDAEAGQALLLEYPGLAAFTDCLSRLDALAPDLGDVTVVSGQSSVAAETAVGRNGDRVGTTFGRYLLAERIGRGAMGVVYRARQQDLDRDVAIKLISAGQFSSQSDIDRFYSEARAAAGMRHPSIVGMLEVGEVDGEHFIAMDLVDGGSLADELQGDDEDSHTVGSSDDSVLLLTAPAGLWRKPVGVRRIDPEVSVGWMVEIARAVEHLHQNGIVHRDLKPANILMDAEGRPLVTDFGLAHVEGDSATQARAGAIVGTPAYMSPEQATGHVEAISARSDVFSLGVILYEMLTGRSPFRVKNPLDTLVRVIESDPELPTRLEPWLSRELEHICLKCLAKDPAQRYESAAALADDLERYLRRENVHARPPGLGHRIQRWGRRQPVLLVHLVALGLAMAIIEAGFLSVGDREQPEIHWRVMAILGAWGLVSVGFQWAMRKPEWQLGVRFAWCAVDAGLLTAVLIQNTVPPGPLVVGYPLLVAASGLFFRVRLVWFMTLSCLLGYAAHLLLRNQMHEQAVSPGTPWQYPILFAVVLAVLGVVVAYQVYRVRVLNRFARRRG